MKSISDKLTKLNNIDLSKIDRLFEEFFISEEMPSSKIISYLLNGTGKKLRPLILLLSAKIAGEITELTYKCATILEALHTASLIHDDIIDLAELRRGENSMNYEFGNKLAVLSGDFLLSRSLSVLAQEPNNYIIQIYAKTSEFLCLGEILEQQCKSKGKVSETEYFEIIKMKTGSLFSACSEIGVITGNGSNELQQKMKTFGENFGIAFQLKDDLLDFIGDTEEIGKETGKDSAENIMTFPLLSIINELSDDEKSKLEDFQQSKEIINNHLGFQKTEKEIIKYSDKCLKILSEFKDTPAVESLRKIVNMNIERKF